MALGWLHKNLQNESSRLYDRFLNLQDKAAREFLPFSQLPDFTDHGIEHARCVQSNLCKLIPEDLPDPLSAFEVFALLAASLLHDVGMLVRMGEEESVEEIRIDHFNRSKRFVVRNHKELGLTEHEAEIIGEICRAHGMPTLTYLDGRLYSLHRFGEVRVPLLSALLRLADILDLTYERAPTIVAANRTLARTSRKFWEVHRWITDIQIRTAPSWDLVIVAMPHPRVSEMQFFELRNYVQHELDTTASLLRGAGLFFKKVELVITPSNSGNSHRRLKNPFLLLAPFTSRLAARFAGRDREIQEVIGKVVAQRLVVVIGESGVGKTSLVEAGVIPQLRAHGFGIIRFAFQDDPIRSLKDALQLPARQGLDSDDLLACLQRYHRHHRKDRKEVKDGEDRKHRKFKHLLLVGDHLEQMFTVGKDSDVRMRFVRDACRVLGSDEPVTFLFCVREDYLPDLYNLSDDISELYNRDNTFRLHRLSRENALAVFERASALALVELPGRLMQKIAGDLCDEGEGTVYPPFLQIVGHRLYAAARRRRINLKYEEMPFDLYQDLGRVETIVNRYLESLLDQYKQEDKAIVGEILNLMVTEHRTKKRVRKREIRSALPECNDLDRLLSKLVQQRIVRRSLGEYELIHDFLAKKVIEFVNAKRFLSPPVRRAIEFMDKKCQSQDLTCGAVSHDAGVSQPHLAALFREQLGVTIKQKLGAMRVSKAKAMLSANRDKLTDVARRSGFRSLSAFSRKFSEVEGVSPQEYRRTVMILESANHGNGNGKPR